MNNVNFVSTSTEDVNLPMKCPTDKMSEGWSYDKNVIGSDFTVEELLATLKTVAKFRTKYKNDDFVQTFEEILRDEICQIFGGTIIDDED